MANNLFQKPQSINKDNIILNFLLIFQKNQQLLIYSNQLWLLHRYNKALQNQFLSDNLLGSFFPNPNTKVHNKLVVNNNQSLLLRELQLISEAYNSSNIIQKLNSIINEIISNLQFKQIRIKIFLKSHLDSYLFQINTFQYEIIGLLFTFIQVICFIYIWYSQKLLLLIKIPNFIATKLVSQRKTQRETHRDYVSHKRLVVLCQISCVKKCNYLLLSIISIQQ
ncbi:hypothetical protein pb186bvf_010478 [Paramecium bursaria]